MQSPPGYFRSGISKNPFAQSISAWLNTKLIRHKISVEHDSCLRDHPTPCSRKYQLMSDVQLKIKTTCILTDLAYTLLHLFGFHGVVAYNIIYNCCRHCIRAGLQFTGREPRRSELGHFASPTALYQATCRAPRPLGTGSAVGSCSNPPSNNTAEE